jgi:aldose 1-epimerase
MLSPEALTYGTLLITGFLALRRSRRAGLTLRRQFGVVEGRPVQLHTLTNARGMEVSVCEYGATLTSIRVPDIHGRLGEVTLGLRSLEDYVAGNPFLGSTVGRYANRLADGQLTVDGQTIALAQNNNGNHLHGGLRGLDKRVWSSEAVRTESASSVRFTYVSPAGEEGYPGTLSVTVTYTLADASDELTIDFAATTDAPTACNLTNHVFFNLAGQGSILDHQVTLSADQLVPVSPALIPTGELMDVSGTPFDFRRPHAIGERIGAPHDQLRRARGYDHCYVLGPDKSLKSAAFVSEPTSGRTLEVLTDAPGLQFYTGNFLTGTVQGRWAKPFAFRQGFCLEPGLFPDSPNQPDFHRMGYPSGILRPGEAYSQKLVFRFGVSR